MRYKTLIIILLAFFTISMIGSVSDSNAQGYIQLLNGKERRFTNATLEGLFINYEPENKVGKTKKLNKFDAFSLNYDDGKTDILYSPDTTFEDDPSVAEVQDYVMGEKFALNYYKAHPRFIASQLYFGFYAGYFSSLLGVYGAAAIPVYAIGADRFGPEMPTSETEGWNESASFVSGYEKVMRKKKTTNSLIGGAIGFTVGITTLAVILND